MTKSGRRTRARGGAAVAVGLAAALGGLLAAGVGEQGSGGHHGAAVALPDAGAGAPTLAPAQRGPRVAYHGPHRIAGHTVLRARVTSAPVRVVAVTFRLDGAPVGTDTTAPYGLDVDAATLPAGRHRIDVEAVDRLGRRARSASRTVHVSHHAGDLLVASPEAGLGEALSALARGHVSVLLRPGRYALPALRLGPGARLYGSGPDTVLASTEPVFAVVNVAGRHVRVADLTIDGGGRAGRGVAVASGSSDVRLQRLRIGGIRANGIEAWGVHRDVSVQDSTIAGDGAEGAGVYDLGSEDSRDVSVVRTTISGFRAYGIDFVQREYGRRSAAVRALALDNRISDIQDPSVANGTREGGIWSGGVGAALIGNRIRNTGWDGIETVGSSTGVSVIGNEIVHTPTGIYLEHETRHSLFARNVVRDVITGLNIEWRYGGLGSSHNAIVDNRVESSSQTGFFIDAVADGNRVEGNVVVGGRGPAIVLQGTSDNLVVGNRGCARGDQPTVQLRSAHHDNGVQANPLRNRLERNVNTSRCTGA